MCACGCVYQGMFVIAAFKEYDIALRKIYADLQCYSARGAWHSGSFLEEGTNEGGGVRCPDMPNDKSDVRAFIKTTETEKNKKVLCALGEDYEHRSSCLPPWIRADAEEQKEGGGRHGPESLF